MSRQATVIRSQLQAYASHAQRVTDSLNGKMAAWTHRELLPTHVAAGIKLHNEEVRRLCKAIKAGDITLQEGYEGITQAINRLQAIEAKFDAVVKEVNAIWQIGDDGAGEQNPEAAAATAASNSRWKTVKGSLKSSFRASERKTRGLAKAFVETLRGGIRAKSVGMIQT